MSSRAEARYVAAQNRPDDPNGPPTNWGDRRGLFEREIGAHRTARYAALNLGSRGTESKYGPYCLVAEAQNVGAVVVVPDNSLVRYVPSATAPVLDHERLQEEVAAWSSRGDVATAKHGAAVSADAASWPDIVCGPTTSAITEVIVMPSTGPLPVTMFVEARMPAANLERARDNQVLLKHATEQGVTPFLSRDDRNDLKAVRFLDAMGPTWLRRCTTSPTDSPQTAKRDAP